MTIQDRVLKDVLLKTGLEFRKIAGIDTSKEPVARAVLPVLAEWVPIVSEPNIRAAIYARFSTPYAAQFLRVMVDWAKKEVEQQSTDRLNCALGNAVDSENAEWLWSVALALPRSSNFYYLAAKLAAFPPIAVDVKNWLVEQVQTQPLGFAELVSIGNVDDPRLFAWFKGRLGAPDKGIRAVAAKVVNRGKKLPAGVAYTSSPPEYSNQLFSTEVDLEDAGSTLKELAKRFGLKVPSSIRSCHFLSRLQTDRWVTAGIKTVNGSDARLYFRLEDVQTVKIWLVPSAPCTPGRINLSRPVDERVEWMMPVLVRAMAVAEATRSPMIDVQHLLAAVEVYINEPPEPPLNEERVLEPVPKKDLGLTERAQDVIARIVTGAVPATIEDLYRELVRANQERSG